MCVDRCPRILHYRVQDHYGSRFVVPQNPVSRVMSRVYVSNRAVDIYVQHVQRLVEVLQKGLENQEHELHAQWQAFVEKRMMAQELNNQQDIRDSSPGASRRAAMRYRRDDFQSSLLRCKTFPPERAACDGYEVIDQNGKWFSELVSYMKDGSTLKAERKSTKRARGASPRPQTVPVWQPCVLTAGGSNTDDGVLARTEMYNPVTCRWEELPPMLRKRANCSVVQLDGKVVTVGGKDENMLPLRSAEEYDPKTARWKYLPDMTAKRASCSAVATGMAGKGWAASAYRMQVLFGLLGVWSDMPRGCVGHCFSWRSGADRLHSTTIAGRKRPPPKCFPRGLDLSKTLNKAKGA